MATSEFAKLSHMSRQTLLTWGFAFLAVPFALGQGAVAAVPGSATYPPSMTFDVASVRESHPDAAKGFMIGGGFVGRTSWLKLSNVKIVDILQKAYGLSSHDISGMSGMPDWTSIAMFNVEAKSDNTMDLKLASLTEEQVALEQQHMLQALLAERFNLKAHWSTREGRVYNLVLARRGPKLRTAGSLPISGDDVTLFGGNKIPEIYQRGDGRRGYEFVGHDCHIASLARKVSGLMGADVIDRTGLSGTYDFALRYSQASDAEREKSSELFPPVPDALEDQLGLKLERATGPIRGLVVDHIDKPSPN